MLPTLSKILKRVIYKQLLLYYNRCLNGFQTKICYVSSLSDIIDDVKAADMCLIAVLISLILNFNGLVKRPPNFFQLNKFLIVEGCMMLFSRPEFLKGQYFCLQFILRRLYLLLRLVNFIFMLLILSLVH